MSCANLAFSNVGSGSGIDGSRFVHVYTGDCLKWFLWFDCLWFYIYQEFDLNEALILIVTAVQIVANLRVQKKT